MRLYPLQHRFGFLGVINIYLNVFMIVALSTVLQWLLDIIFDLDHPFYGVWNVNRNQLDALRRKLAGVHLSHAPVETQV